jgi:hypothetical protein
MPEIAFQVNEFRVYQVNVEGVSFGFINTGSGAYSPAKGEQFEYDGNTVILEDGREFTDVPQLRSAIEGGWCVPVGTKVKQYTPKAAGIQVRATEQRGSGRPTKVSVETHQADERVVVSVADRKRAREATNETAARNVPLESAEARSVATTTGDDDLDAIVSAIDDEMEDWAEERESEQLLEEMLESQEEDREAEVKARAEADILELLASVDDAPAPRPARRTAAERTSARHLPVDAEDDRVTMPIVREDSTEAGTVVGKVGDQQRVVVEREEEIAMNVARATPQAQSPKPKPRMGGAGAIVVDEQREVSTISLSSNAAPIRLDESAKVQSGNTESIRMGDGAQVGTRKKTAAQKVQTAEGQEGVAVSRVLTPTHQSFEADDRNTSSTSIQRAQEGKQLRVEKYEADDEVVGTVGGAREAAEEASEARTTGAVATGDVEEATAGDELTDVLPDAAVSPTPEVHRPAAEDPAYAAVKMLVPDFEWNKDRKVPERVAAAMKHVENPLYIKGILAVETDLAREEIKKALAAELEKRQAAKKAK